MGTCRRSWQDDPVRSAVFTRLQAYCDQGHPDVDCHAGPRRPDGDAVPNRTCCTRHPVFRCPALYVADDAARDADGLRLRDPVRRQPDVLHDAQGSGHRPADIRARRTMELLVVDRGGVAAGHLTPRFHLDLLSADVAARRWRVDLDGLSGHRSGRDFRISGRLRRHRERLERGKAHRLVKAAIDGLGGDIGRPAADDLHPCSGLRWRRIDDRLVGHDGLVRSGTGRRHSDLHVPVLVLRPPGRLPAADAGNRGAVYPDAAIPGAPDLELLVRRHRVRDPDRAVFRGLSTPLPARQYGQRLAGTHDTDPDDVDLHPVDPARVQLDRDFVV